MGSNWKGSVTQSGVVVASVIGRDREQVERETMHYALIYAQDGPVTVKINGKPVPAPPKDAEG